MILTEQKYTNLYRSYFHGAKTGQLEKSDSFFDYFYLTNSFAYAAMYACNYDAYEGSVYEFKLREGLNIFNARSKADILKIRVYARKEFPELNNDWYWKGLFEEDWNFIFSENIALKDKLIKSIKACEYDGFFDYEWTPNFKKKFRVEKGKLIDTSPAIGIFDIKKLRQVAVYQYVDYFKHRDFVKIYNKEKRYLIGYAVSLHENDVELLREKLIREVQDEYAFLNLDDIDEIIQNIDAYEKDKDYPTTVYNTKEFAECVKKGFSENYELDKYFRLRHRKNRDKARASGFNLDSYDDSRQVYIEYIHPKKHLYKKESK